MSLNTPEPDREWWRSAVIYQVYPRSFADGNGDGIGDLAGATPRLAELAELGVDAVWFSPFYRSPQLDAGYDVSDYCDIDPVFGTLDDFDRMLGRAHELGLRVIIDLVPNHSSWEHPWFRAALAAAPGSPERARYIFRDGLGEAGDVPPNNWQSLFGGPAWTRVTEADGTPGQWYLHLFDTSQPDWDWTNPEVVEFFHGVLRFWFDRGADGFRVDVAHALFKQAGLPDMTPVPKGETLESRPQPFFGQPGVHEIYRGWRRIADRFEPARVFVGEAWVQPASELAKWVRPDEFHQTFNFPYLMTAFDAEPLRKVIDDSIAAFGAVGAPSTWVLGNHDVVRPATRFAYDPPLDPPGPTPETEAPDAELGLRRARAASAFMLGLPGSAYIYQGEELGLPEVLDLPAAARQDPTFARTGGELLGRDGCRVPLPWERMAPNFGFGDGAASWLPQPAEFAELARDQQRGIDGSTLTLFTKLLSRRREYDLGHGSLEWLPDPAPGVLAYRNGAVIVVANTSANAARLPAGELLLASVRVSGSELPAYATAWLLAAD